jgi:ABC-type multidrug transport system ATPase subunit
VRSLPLSRRQMVEIAKALGRNPKLLILDEATSSLDIPSERVVHRALAAVLADRTVLLIAQQLSTVTVADRILVLDHGRIVKDSPSDELTHPTDRQHTVLHQCWCSHSRGCLHRNPREACSSGNGAAAVMATHQRTFAHVQELGRPQF